MAYYPDIFCPSWTGKIKNTREWKKDILIIFGRFFFYLLMIFLKSDFFHVIIRSRKDINFVVHFVSFLNKFLRNMPNLN